MNKNIETFKILQENTTARSIASQEFWRIESYCFEAIEKVLNIRFKKDI